MSNDTPPCSYFLCHFTVHISRSCADGKLGFYANSRPRAGVIFFSVFLARLSSFFGVDGDCVFSTVKKTGEDGRVVRSSRPSKSSWKKKGERVDQTTCPGQNLRVLVCLLRIVVFGPSPCHPSPPAARPYCARPPLSDLPCVKKKKEMDNASQKEKTRKKENTNMLKENPIEMPTTTPSWLWGVLAAMNQEVPKNGPLLAVVVVTRFPYSIPMLPSCPVSTPP